MAGVLELYLPFFRRDKHIPDVWDGHVWLEFTVVLTVITVVLENI